METMKFCFEGRLCLLDVAPAVLPRVLILLTFQQQANLTKKKHLVYTYSTYMKHDSLSVSICQLRESNPPYQSQRCLANS